MPDEGTGSCKPSPDKTTRPEGSSTDLPRDTPQTANEEHGQGDEQVHDLDQNRNQYQDHEHGRDWIAQTSRERVASLKSSREASLGSTSTMPPPPLPPPSLNHSYVSNNDSNHPISSHSPPTTTTAPSPIPALLHKLTYITSLLVGTTALTSLFFSTFLLPLLHSSFSARKALVDQQMDRLRGLVFGLQGLRRCAIYAQHSNGEDREGSSVKSALSVSSGRSRDVRESGGSDGSGGGGGSERGIEEISSHSSHHTTDRLVSKPHIPWSQPPSHVQFQLSTSTSTSTTTTSATASATPLHPLSALSNLSTSLQSLSLYLNSTTTTRTSLLSTLESYTSSLHRSIYIRPSTRPWSGVGGAVGLNTSSQNLKAAGSVNFDHRNGRDARDEGGELDALGGIEGRVEEWDAVRKEIRAIKGLLLGRRNFQPTSTAPANGH